MTLKALRTRARTAAGGAKPADPIVRVRHTLDAVLVAERRHHAEVLDQVESLRAQLDGAERRHADEIATLERRHARELAQIHRERQAELDEARRVGQVETRCQERTLGLGWV